MFLITGGELGYVKSWILIRKGKELLLCFDYGALGWRLKLIKVQYFATSCSVWEEKTIYMLLCIPLHQAQVRQTTFQMSFLACRRYHVQAFHKLIPNS